MMDYDGKHKRRLYQHLKEVERLFERLIAQTSSIAIKLKLKEELFRFKKHPKAIKDINKVLNEYQNSLLDTIQVCRVACYEYFIKFFLVIAVFNIKFYNRE